MTTAVSSGIAGQGTLPSSPLLIRTATTTEYHVNSFLNTGTVTGTLNVWINGTLDYNRVIPSDLALPSRNLAVLKVKLGEGNTVYASGTPTGIIVYTDEMDSLT